MPVAVLEFDGLPKGTEHCMTVEPFSPVLTIIRIPSSGPGSCSAALPAKDRPDASISEPGHVWTPCVH